MSEFVLSNRIRYYFNEISKIPHGSYNEAKLVEYLAGFAKEHGLRCLVQPVNNVIIFKDASKGYEDHETVMMQAHIDMVCEKTKESSHNFETDPLQLHVEDDWLKANNTTLGGDDGYGVAYMLAILEDNSLNHPALECIFTRCEEVGLIGAKDIDTSVLKATRYINLDAGGETHTTVSSSGGRRQTISRGYMVVDLDKPTYKLTVGGLDGGHSGGCIDQEKGNAIKIAFRLLRNLSRNKVDMNLVSGFGGAKENAIARDCEVVFASANENVAELLANDIMDIKNELAATDSKLYITIEPTEKASKGACPKCSKAIVELVDLLPCGLIHRDLQLGIPVASLNAGIFSLKDGKCDVMYSIRSPFESYKNQLSNQIADIAEIFDAEVTISNDYCGWVFEPNSSLREILRSVLANHGRTLVESATHGGLETGVFKGKMPALDIITYGPISESCHTPEERLYLPSFDYCYDILVEVLANC